VTVLGFVSVIGAIWWGIAICALLLSFVAALCFPRPRYLTNPSKNLPPVTAIIPVKDFDPRFERAQTSLFSQNYPDLEILVAAAEQDSSALDAVRRVQQEHPGVSSRIVWSQINRGVSPKLNNLWAPVDQARDDLILTKDSNVVLEPQDVAAFVAHFGAGVGLVSTIPIASEPQSPAAWIEAAIINCYYARMLMLARVLGLGFGCGKIMLFRRSDMERAGGFQSLAGALGEDAALAAAMSSIGLRTVLADRVTRQPLGVRRLGEVWERQLRWKSIWRVQVPLVFAISVFGSALLAAVAGAAAAPLIGLSPLTIAAATLACWFLLETCLCLFQGWPFSIWSPFAFLGREALDVLVWLRALTVSEVSWAGARYRLDKPVLMAPFDAKLAPIVQQGAGTTDAL
jgi:ceramide glucosyltransferase